LSASTLPITATGFERAFASIATMRPRRAYEPRYAAEWRELAWATLERKKLRGVLRRPTGALSARDREVLFLHDVKNLDAAETAWVLQITVDAVRSRLRRARTQMRDALAASLLAKRNRKDSRSNNVCMRFPANFSSQPAAFASLA